MTTPAPLGRVETSPEMRIVPVTFRDAAAFVDANHRHHPAPRGALFCIGLAQGDTLVGVAVVGRPVARMLQDGFTAEVTRTCLAGDVPNGNSKLYGAAWRAARALGYRRLITYTQEGETGASLRGAGWRLIAERAPRPGWDTASRRRLNRNANVQRYLWEAGAWRPPAP